ncbi:unnamed protein product [Colias eurytheme]|nr:unnamed protein product [Colias eurytheme]
MLLFTADRISSGPLIATRTCNYLRICVTVTQYHKYHSLHCTGVSGQRSEGTVTRAVSVGSRSTEHSREECVQGGAPRDTGAAGRGGEAAARIGRPGPPLAPPRALPAPRAPRPAPLSITSRAFCRAFIGPLPPFDDG